MASLVPAIHVLLSLRRNDRSDAVVRTAMRTHGASELLERGVEPNATILKYDNPGLAAGRLRTAPRPGYAPTLLTSVFRATIASD